MSNVIDAMRNAIEWAHQVSDEAIDGEEGLRAEYAKDLKDATAAVSAITGLIEAAQFALDKAWEYGEDEPHFAKLNAALVAVRGEQS